MSAANQDPLSLPDWMRRQLDHATAVEHGEANERRGIVLGNGYFSLTPMDEQPARRWEASNSYTSWKVVPRRVV